jgi:hypothetical protein
LIKQAQALGKDLFAYQGPSEEEDLFLFLQQQLQAWNTDLAGYQPLAKTENYPGLEEIEAGLAALRKFVDEPDSLRFLNRFNDNANELRDLAEDMHELSDFYIHQKHSWETLRKTVEQLRANRMQLYAKSMITWSQRRGIRPWPRSEIISIASQTNLSKPPQAIRCDKQQ